jgi:tetratricopeptide (TPR) repeat protein
MADRNGGIQAAFCPDCGLQLWSQWGFCPRCGRTLDDLHVSLWENASGPMTPPPVIRSAEANTSLELLRAGLVMEAEERLRASMHESPADVEVHLILADMLVKRFEIQEAGALYDEAAAVAPDHFLVRLRRAEFLARLGRYSDAVQDLSAARRLPAPDFQTLMYSQELYRWVSSRLQGSFTRTTGPPRLPAWVRGLSTRIRRGADRLHNQREEGEDDAISDAVHDDAGADALASAHANWPS